jgi:hypothetical protein
VIFTVIESLTPDGRDRSLDHKISRLHFPKGSWEAEVIPELAPVGDEIVIPKTASGIFNATNVEYVLRNLGIEYLVVYGIMTDQCIESTVRDAADRGFLVTSRGCLRRPDRGGAPAVDHRDGRPLLPHAQHGGPDRRDRGARRPIAAQYRRLCLRRPRGPAFACSEGHA